MSTVPFQYEPFVAFSAFSDLGPYRANDYWELPEGEPCELICGRLIMSPCPTPKHQMIVILLAEMFLNFARSSGGFTVCAPMDVVLSDDTILQPDLLYISKERRKIVQQRIEGPPDLVVEILSPGTERRDRLAKLDLYARYGVKEYWIVDPASELFEFLLNDDGRFTVLSQTSDELQSPSLPEVKIQLADFWKEVTARMA